jgi:hypothetical protein
MQTRTEATIPAVAMTSLERSSPGVEKSLRHVARAHDLQKSNVAGHMPGTANLCALRRSINPKRYPTPSRKRTAAASHSTGKA